MTKARELIRLFEQISRGEWYEPMHQSELEPGGRWYDERRVLELLAKRAGIKNYKVYPGSQAYGPYLHGEFDGQIVQIMFTFEGDAFSVQTEQGPSIVKNAEDLKRLLDSLKKKDA